MLCDIEIKGYCGDKFNDVKDVFRGNFEYNLEVGASFAVTMDGKHVIDI